MAVRINRPPVNIREKLSELERPIGLNGSALMRTETPQEAFSLIGAGRKNLLINGNFKFWQRGTSFTNSPVYTADRWFNISNHTGSTVTRESFANGQTEVPGGPEYFYRSSITSTSTPGDRIAWGQKIENWKLFLGNTFTLSGWYRRTCALSGTALQLTMHQSSGFYDVSHTMSYSTDDLFPITSTWKFFKLTFTVPSTAAGTMTDSANYTLRLYYQVCGASGNFDLANMQLEQGKVATPFEYRSYAEELALCQRYFYRFRCANQEWIYNEGNLNDRKWHQFYIGHPMRVNPSVDVSNLATGGSISGMPGVTISSISPQTPGDTPGRISSRVTTSGAAGSAYNLHHTDVWQNNYISLSAEL